MRTRRYLVLVIFACALIGACSKPAPRVGPKFTGRLLLLAANSSGGTDLVELAATPGGPGYQTSVLAAGVFETSPNPDQTQLLYATRDQIVLRDVRSGADKSLVKGQNFCLSWAPDGTRFSFKQKSAAGTKLYVSDLEGKTKMIWEDTSGAGNTLAEAAAVERANAASTCGHWIAPNRLVFDRFLGGLLKKGAEPPKANTTTLVILNEPPTFIDTDRKWSVDGVCKSGNAIMREKDQGQPVLGAKSLDQIKTLDPSPISCSGCRFIGFAARSCVPFFVEQNSSTATDVFSLNPTNWQRLKSASIAQVFSPNARMVIKSSARQMILGDSPSTLLLVDTESGETVSLSPQSPLSSPFPVLWIEN
jgi:hypothetical protein